ncbi:MAG TPA: twin-arginine translocase TatA/TatE family subunit [Salinimicrobium sp.]|nr:twin-arginine translocase TatA/TatE family subunit [Salinimicrobium sp.]
METLPLIIGLSGAEIGFIIFIAIMVFGADKVPDMARGLGKGMREIKNATNDIKDEVMKSSEKHGIDTKGMTGDVKKEIDKVKEDIDEITGSVKRRY